MTGRLKHTMKSEPWVYNAKTIISPGFRCTSGAACQCLIRRHGDCSQEPSDYETCTWKSKSKSSKMVGCLEHDSELTRNAPGLGFCRYVIRYTWNNRFSEGWIWAATRTLRVPGSNVRFLSNVGSAHSITPMHPLGQWCGGRSPFFLCWIYFLAVA